MPVLIDDVAGVDRFFIKAGFADVTERFINRHLCLEIDKLRRHNAAGAVGRVLKNLVDAAAQGRVRVLDDTLDNVGRHFFDNRYGIIGKQLTDHCPEFVIRETANHSFLFLGVHFNEGFCCQVFRQQAKNKQKLIVFHFVQRFCQINRLHFVHQRVKLTVFFLFQKREQLLTDGLFHVHFTVPPNRAYSNENRLPEASRCKGTQFYPSDRLNRRKTVQREGRLHRRGADPSF